MPYIRKMKDGSEKVYYTSSEMKEKIRKRILLSSIEFKKEILKKERLNNKKMFNSENIFNKKLSYV